MSFLSLFLLLISHFALFCAPCFFSPFPLISLSNGLSVKGASQMMLVVKNLPAIAGHRRSGV